MKRLISFLIRNIPRKYLQSVSGTGLRVVSLFYLGSKVRCPICEHGYRKFLPYGRVSPRENALCPSCLSLERHRLIWLYLQNRTDFLSRQQDVLHIAPEMCFLKRFEKIHKEKYITADLESPWAKVKMDIHSMPFEDNRFDAVLCNHVLEHVDDDIKAMKEIYRVLKPGGWAILQVPFFSPVADTTFEDHSVTDPAERTKLFGQDDHVRRYGKDFPQRIKSAGLQPNEDAFANSFSGAEAYRFGIMPGEVLYIGRK